MTTRLPLRHALPATLALLLAFAPASWAQNGRAGVPDKSTATDHVRGDGSIHDTGDVQFEVFDFGELGAYADAGGVSIGTGFVLDGENGLYESTFLVGISSTQVSGDAYEFPDVEWQNTLPLASATPPEGFDQAFETAYSDAAAVNPIGVEVTQFSVSAEDDDFVIVAFDVENTSGADLEDVYLGIFADWDVGAFAQNLGAYNEDQQVQYVWEDGNDESKYYGIAALNGEDGVDVSGVFYDALPGDELLFSGLTNILPDAELPADRRNVLGVGPYDIAMGETVTVAFAYVGGTDEADLLANAAAAQAAVAPPLEEAIHDTGDVQFEVFADGNLGTQSPAPFAGTGFVFEGDNGLFASTTLVGVGPDQVSGMAYTTGEWVTTSPLAVGAAPENFDQAFLAAYDDSGAPNPIGVEVEQFTYSSSEDGFDDFVIIEYEVGNTSGSDLDDVYVGIFADWDVGAATMNLADYDEDTQLLYVWDDGGAPNYYGMTVIGSETSGYAFDAGAGNNPQEADLWAGMTFTSIPPELPDDRRTVIGTGPFDIADGDEITVRFAFVGGEDEDEIIANAAAARSLLIPVAAEQGTPEGLFTLHSAYPNPFAGTTTLGFSIPTSEHVRLTVYDLLGRRIATLVDGARTAGDHTVRFDAAGLSSGTYLYRLEAGAAQLTERFTLVR